MSGRPALINRYRWWEAGLIYCGIAVFLAFLLAPFVEGFLVSLKPLSLQCRVNNHSLATHSHRLGVCGAALRGV